VKLISTKLEIISTNKLAKKKNCASQVKLQLLFACWHWSRFVMVNLDLPVTFHKAMIHLHLWQVNWLMLTHLCQHLHLDATMEKI